MLARCGGSLSSGERHGSSAVPTSVTMTMLGECVARRPWRLACALFIWPMNVKRSRGLPWCD